MSRNNRIIWNPAGGDNGPPNSPRPIAEWSASLPSRGSRPTPVLDQIGRDVTRLAGEGRLSKHFGRDRELLQLQQTMLRKTKNNPILLGLPGVGKTALVEGLAQRIAEGHVAPALREVRIIEVSVSALTAGTEYRGTLESRLHQIVAEIAANPNLFLFVDEIHTLVHAGSLRGEALDAANILKPALARGELRCIGATTPDEFERYLRSDPALERRFEPIRIEPPSTSEAIEILNAARVEYEEYHHVQITPEAIEVAVTLSERYLLDRSLPDKAFDLLDNACAHLRLLAPSDGSTNSATNIVGDSVVTEALAESLRIPIIRLGEDIQTKLVSLDSYLEGRVIGQAQAMARITAAIRQAYSSLRNPNRPRQVFAFFGSSGVGKTLTAKALAEHLFGSSDALIRLDMSEFKDAFTLSRLWGAPPGYVGYGDEGTFASRLRRQSFCIVLLDEFEKAHPQVHDAFLQIFDEGRFVDGRGRLVDARHAMFVLTSNLFANTPASVPADPDQIVNVMRSQLSTVLRPEFVNRIDDLVWFRPLDLPDLAHIVELQIADLNERLAPQDKRVEATPQALFWIANRVPDPENGARAVIRAVTRYVIEPIAAALVQHRIGSGPMMALRVQNGSLILDDQLTPADLSAAESQ